MDVRDIIRHLMPAEQGQDAAEYSLLMALLVIVAMIGILAFGSGLAVAWGNIVALFTI
jgi:Flp pilus assembly pilin Flp